MGTGPADDSAPKPNDGAAGVALLSRMAARDASALGEFYDRMAPRILGLLVRILRDRSAADDVLQDTFMEIWERARQYDPKRSSPFAWATLIARCRACDALRRGRRREVEGRPAVQLGDPSDAERAEARAATRGALARLPDEQRTAIELAYFSGLTHDEIARFTLVPLGTVKTRIRLGMRRMREMLDESRRLAAS